MLLCFNVDKIKLYTSAFPTVHQARKAIAVFAFKILQCLIWFYQFSMQFTCLNPLLHRVTNW